MYIQGWAFRSKICPVWSGLGPDVAERSGPVRVKISLGPIRSKKKKKQFPRKKTKFPRKKKIS